MSVERSAAAPAPAPWPPIPVVDAPLRAWLEPGYDGGRFGGWLLGWPGAFAWAPDRDALLSRLGSRAGWHLDWLADHGEVLPMPIRREPEVVEEVPVEVVDGYERKATFSADRSPLTDAAWETWVRRWGWAREDLAALVARGRGLLASPAGGALDAEDHARVARSFDEVVQHVAGSTAWLASRIEPSARYRGPLEGDDAAVLDATRAWALDVVTEARARDPIAFLTDGKGQTWTVAKVVRRLLYHDLDHLEELDRRLALAEGRVERVEWRTGAVPPEDYAHLLILIGRGSRTGDRERVARMLGNADLVVSGWAEGRLVAIARAFLDDAWSGYVSSVFVHPRWQGRGVGRALMGRVLEGHPDVRFVLDAAPGTEAFYRRLGFEPDPVALSRPRDR